MQRYKEVIDGYRKKEQEAHKKYAYAQECKDVEEMEKQHGHVCWYAGLRIGLEMSQTIKG